MALPLNLHFNVKLLHRRKRKAIKQRDMDNRSEVAFLVKWLEKTFVKQKL
jgi:hypothetical protein